MAWKGWCQTEKKQQGQHDNVFSPYIRKINERLVRLRVFTGELLWYVESIMSPRRKSLYQPPNHGRILVPVEPTDNTSVVLGIDGAPLIPARVGLFICLAVLICSLLWIRWILYAELRASLLTRAGAPMLIKLHSVRLQVRQQGLFFFFDWRDWIRANWMQLVITCPRLNWTVLNPFRKPGSKIVGSWYPDAGSSLSCCLNYRDHIP